jgi:hypothetical protein
MVSQPRHRPQRQFPEAERRIVPCDLDNCPHCGDRLHSRNPWHMRKTVQTLKGPLLVAGRSKECVNAACPHVGQHYYASGSFGSSIAIPLAAANSVATTCRRHRLPGY